MMLMPYVQILLHSVFTSLHLQISKSHKVLHINYNTEKVLTIFSGTIGFSRSGAQNITKNIHIINSKFDILLVARSPY